MTLPTEKDLDEASRQAQWAACYRLRNFVGGETASLQNELMAAAFHAGEAWAYYQASDVVATLKSKLATKQAK